jgi:hypothetical protein
MWSERRGKVILIHELFHIHFRTYDRTTADPTDNDNDQQNIDLWVKAFADSLEKCRSGDQK